MTLNSVLIVGGGVAGVTVAAELRKRSFDGRVTVLESGATPHDRPPLSKGYLEGSKCFDDIALQPSGWYAEHDIDLQTSARVVELRPSTREVILADESSLSGDIVVLATGGAPARPSIPGSDDERVHVLRNVQDANRLRTALLPGARLLILGAGLIGAEVAGTARLLGAEVTIVDPVDTPLRSAVGAELADWLHNQHGAHGVHTIVAGVERFVPNSAGLDAELTTGANLGPFDAVLLAVGMHPSTELAQSAGLAVDQGIVVDSAQRTSNPSIFAVGDPTRRQVGDVLRRRAEHWEAAQLDGTRVAAAITGIDPPAEGCSWFWSDRYGLHLEAVGSMTDAAATVTRGELGEASFAVFGIRDGVVVGAAAIDDGSAIRAARRLIDRRIAIDPMKLADPATDLRKLVRR